ncbi:hypothetical protein, conserved [Trypanosoma brucei gambiense DAL972]|uniref:RecQ-mediated genome instability protein 1 n=2 Tax=Trypanosoma brucei TaxID=5691 RepID=C9ZUY2_TRYB9|nr:hypothetical protein, conserved [Trypanosoma brucei gambiense DAL972]RHW71094.1 hypothetical protein DPX39_080020900 [Trypanosoma brucei equiperdum]CBH13220.1 hypothetical protein, conserved [Trypanosoma brucei gambiense DAL972]|eukprot:XP_011775497.1 hypothetical protein, conserved [Trypanosoma brucei gambiense DAL972]
MAALHEEVRTRYHIAVCTRFVERVCVDTPSPTAEFIYKMALNENLKDITDVGTLPRVSLLQLNSLPCSLVLQVSSSRDVTQPLRPCLDTSEEEPILAAAFQKNLKTRLLRLVLSDGHSEVPAVELSTLSVFRSIPVPGEKLLVKEGAEIKNGAIIMTDDCVVPLGGGVQQLKKEVLIQQSRSDAPRFQPLRFGVSTPAGARAAAGPLSDSFDRDRGGNVGRARGRGLGYRGGRESGYRGQRPHNHHYNRPQ